MLQCVIFLFFAAFGHPEVDTLDKAKRALERKPDFFGYNLNTGSKVGTLEEVIKAIAQDPKKMRLFKQNSLKVGDYQFQIDTAQEPELYVKMQEKPVRFSLVPHDENKDGKWKPIPMPELIRSGQVVFPHHYPGAVYIITKPETGININRRVKKEPLPDSEEERWLRGWVWVTSRLLKRFGRIPWEMEPMEPLTEEGPVFEEIRILIAGPFIEELRARYPKLHKALFSGEHMKRTEDALLSTPGLPSRILAYRSAVGIKPATREDYAIFSGVYAGLLFIEKPAERIGPGFAYSQNLRYQRMALFTILWHHCDSSQCSRTRRDTRLRKCAQCPTHYCSRRCQKRAWNQENHKKHCLVRRYGLELVG